MNDLNPSRPARNHRLDFFRGVVLLIVLIDHIEELNRVSVISRFTPDAFGFSDSAEAFVFLSGYTFGLVYDRRILNDGILPALTLAVGRSISIYTAYLFVLAIIIMLGIFFRAWVPDFSVLSSLDLPGKDQILSGLLISNHPYGMPVLGFFVTLLADRHHETIGVDTKKPGSF